LFKSERANRRKQGAGGPVEGHADIGSKIVAGALRMI
jgi:hypothetical protein